MPKTLELAKALIKCPSVTPNDAGCQALIAKRLATVGFQNTTLNFEDVTNLWSTSAIDGQTFVFAGHTDVVPPGDPASWTYPPFEAQLANGNLYGRGAADMKSSIAAMIVAIERLAADKPLAMLPGRIGLLITSDEEGPAVNGTRRVMEHLQSIDCKIDTCLVGEPSSTSRIGDVIKVGRRGSLNGRITIKGKQGHVAYPHLAKNPIHLFTPALQQLCQEVWDKGNEYFPPTSFQVSNITSGTGAENVIPDQLQAQFNFRFSTQVTATQIKRRVETILKEHQLQFDLDWRLSGEPFLTRQGGLVDVAIDAVEKITGHKPELSTSGGTSDGRFIAPTGTEVIELGPINASIHQIDEHVNCADLEMLTDIYTEILRNLFMRN